jgi:hypothetical protein
LEVVAAHAGLAGDARGDHDHLGARGVLVVVRADDAGVRALDRRRLHHVEALALRHALDDIDQHHVGELAVGDPLRERRPDVARPDHRHFPVHEAPNKGSRRPRDSSKKSITLPVLGRWTIRSMGPFSARC